MLIVTPLPHLKDVVMIAEHLFWISDGTPWSLDLISTTIRRYDENSDTGLEQLCPRLQIKKVVNDIFRDMHPPAHAYELDFLTADILKRLALKYVDKLMVHRIQFRVESPGLGEFRFEVPFPVDE